MTDLHMYTHKHTFCFVILTLAACHQLTAQSHLRRQMSNICFHVIVQTVWMLHVNTLPVLHPACRRLDGGWNSPQSSWPVIRKLSSAHLFLALILRNKTCLLLLLMSWIWEPNQTVLTRYLTAVLCLRPLRTMVLFVGGSIWCLETGIQFYWLQKIPCHQYLISNSRHTETLSCYVMLITHRV